MSNTTGETRIMGCVKFFDKSAGFGFISVLKNAEFPQFTEKDIFVHYSGIHIENQQYKYLVKGEYVEFRIVPSTKPVVNTDGDAKVDTDKFNAVDITGIQGGKLMCETNFNEYAPKSNRPPQSSYHADGPANGEGGDDMDIDDIATPRVTRRPPQQSSYNGDGGRGGGRGFQRRPPATGGRGNTRPPLRKTAV
jgi:cold shock CspA family protein